MGKETLSVLKANPPCRLARELCSAVRDLLSGGQADPTSPKTRDEVGVEFVDSAPACASELQPMCKIGL